MDYSSSITPGPLLGDPGHEQRLIFVLVEILVGFVLNGLRRVSQAWRGSRLNIQSMRTQRTENNEIGRDGGDNKVLRCEGGLCLADPGSLMARGKLWFMRGQGNDQVSFNPLPPVGFG